MKQQIKIKNNYFLVSNESSTKDSTLKLVLNQNNLVGINVLNKDIILKCSNHINSFEILDLNRSNQLLTDIRNIFKPNKDVYNVVSETDIDFSIIIFAVIELILNDVQLKKDSLERILELFEHYYFEKSNFWVKYPLPSRREPWRIINGVNTKKFDIIKSYLSSYELSVEEKIQKTLDYILTNVLPHKFIKEVEQKKTETLALIENENIKVKYTLLPQISYVESDSIIDFTLGHAIAPIVIYEVSSKFYNKKGNILSKLYINDFANSILSKEKLVEKLNESFIKDERLNWSLNKGLISSNYFDKTKLKYEKVILLIGNYIK